MPPNLGIQVLDRLEMGLRRLGNNSDGGILSTVHPNPIELQRGVVVLLGELKPISFRVGENQLCRENPEDIPLGFKGEVELVVVIGSLFKDFRHEPAFAHVVGGNGQGPRPKGLVKDPEVPNHRPGGGEDIPSLVDALVDNETVFPAGVLRELPEPYGPLSRARVRSKGALSNGNVFEIVWHATFCEHLLNLGEIAAGALQPENYLGPIPQGEHELLFQPFSNLLNLQRGPFTTELQLRGYPER